MKLNQEQMQLLPSQVIIFQEADGWHYSPAASDYLDARGKGYKSKAAALRAARESHRFQIEYTGKSNFHSNP